MNQDQLSEQAGNLDWQSLESKQWADPNEEAYDKEAIEAEKKRLSEAEKALPYPDDFLADINLLSRSLKSNKVIVVSEESLEEEEESQDEEE